MSVLATEGEIKILRLLQERGDYAMALVRRGRLRQGSAYVMLGRLCNKGFVKREPDKTRHTGMRRPVYRLTDMGYRMLEAWAILTS